MKSLLKLLGGQGGEFTPHQRDSRVLEDSGGRRGTGKGQSERSEETEEDSGSEAG